MNPLAIFALVAAQGALDHGNAIYGDGGCRRWDMHDPDDCSGCKRDHEALVAWGRSTSFAADYCILMGMCVTDAYTLSSSFGLVSAGPDED